MNVDEGGSHICAQIYATSPTKFCPLLNAINYFTNLPSENLYNIQWKRLFLIALLFF